MATSSAAKASAAVPPVQSLGLCWQCQQPTEVLIPDDRASKLICPYCVQRAADRYSGRRSKKAAKDTLYRSGRDKGVVNRQRRDNAARRRQLVMLDLQERWALATLMAVTGEGQGGGW